MKNYVLGIPILNKPYLLYNLLNSISVDEFPKKLVIVDNGNLELDNIFELKRYRDNDVEVDIIKPEYNWGVSKSWNEIIRDNINDYPVMISNSDIVFAHGTINLFLDFINNEYKFVWLQRGYSLFMITKECIDEIGYFDENFYPAYVEDLDYARRILLHNNLKVEALECSDVIHGNGSTVGDNHESAFAYFIRECRSLNNEYYHKKWGINNEFKLPFTNKPFTYWILDEELFQKKMDIFNKYFKK